MPDVTGRTIVTFDGKTPVLGEEGAVELLEHVADDDPHHAAATRTATAGFPGVDGETPTDATPEARE